MMKLEEFFDRYIFTRKCIVCGDMLSYDMRNEAFCKDCRMKWEIAKTEVCENCGRAVCECSCMTKTLSNSGAICHKKAVLYSSQKIVQHNTVMFIKRNSSPRVARFLGRELAFLLKDDDDVKHSLPDEILVTYVPRSKNAILKYGHDQSMTVAMAIAENMGVDFQKTLDRGYGGRMQKKLNAEQRAKNARDLYSICIERDQLVGKTVILVDDVVTTGASMAACVKPLVRAGAKYVICLSVASTPLKNK